MKNVEPQYLRVPEYRRSIGGESNQHLVDIREHAVEYPIFDLVTPKDDDTSSVGETEEKLDNQ